MIKKLILIKKSVSVETVPTVSGAAPLHMVLKCRRFGVKRVFLSGFVYTKKISWQILHGVHDRLVSLCKRLEIKYIDDRNLSKLSLTKISYIDDGETHLFNGGLHLSDSSKRILANNFVFN